MNKFVELLSSEHSKTIINLAKFVYFGPKSVCKFLKKTVIICRCYKLLYSNGIIILSPLSDTAHIVYITLYYVFAHNMHMMGLCQKKHLYYTML